MDRRGGYRHFLAHLHLSMDFFDRQILARRRLRFFLIIYFVTFLAVALLLYPLVAICVHVWGTLFASWDKPFWNWEIFGWTCLGFGGFVAATVLRRYFLLRNGGPAVASLLRGKRLSETASNLKERQLHNVVEEMAVAAGIAKPEIYIFENELGINALVAGFTIEDSIIGLTRGAVDNLNRAELQAVVAHEFSHILNGDMRLNLWMICLLHGLFAVHELGVEAVHSIIPDEGGSIASNWTQRGSNVIGNVIVAALGAVLMAIGYVGFMFGRLVQCAISRQREWIADAAAVEFTRNPQGLAGALLKVGGWSRGGGIEHPFAEEAGHIFFVDGVNGVLARILTTHPPLEARIRILDPTFDGRFPVILDERALRRSKIIRVPDIKLPDPPPPSKPVLDRVQAQAITAAIGQLEASRLERSRAILERIPIRLREAVRTPDGAAAVLLFLIGADGEDGEGLSMDELSVPFPDEHHRPDPNQLAPACGSLDRKSRLALVELAIPALHSIEKGDYEVFRQRAEILLEKTGGTIYQICIFQIVTEHFDRQFGCDRRTEKRIYSIGSHWEEISILLGSLARAGRKDNETAWKAALSKLPATFHKEPLQKPATPQALHRAFSVLHQLSPGIRRRVLNAAVHCAASDGTVSPEEAELLRAVAAALGCPAPPILAVPAPTGCPFSLF